MLMFILSFFMPKDSALSRKSKDYTQAQIEHKEKVESLTSEWNKLKGQNDALEFDIKQVRSLQL